MRERVRHSRANLLLFVVFERIRSIFFLFYARVCVSLSLSLRARFDEREGERLSLFSLLSAGVRLRASFSKAREREREMEMENFLEASLSLWKKNLEISFSAHQIKTQRERESDRFDERVDNQKRRA